MKNFGSYFANSADMDGSVLHTLNFSIGSVAKFIEVCGGLTILLGGAWAIGQFLRDRIHKVEGSYEKFRGS